MEWLEAALAFALTMLVFATIVTIILEGGYRLLLTREAGFRLMMERFFDEVLAKRVAHLLAGADLERARCDFLQAVTRNPAYAKLPGPIRSRLQPGTISSMTMMQLADRLADTQVGQALARADAEHVKVVINDLAQKFDRIGAAVSQRFQDQARAWCVGVSIAVAFAANVDAIRVFQTLLHDDDARARITATRAALLDRQSPQGLQQAPTDAGTSESAPQEAIATLETDIRRSSAEARGLAAAGLPVTAKYYPYCRDSIAPQIASDPRCNQKLISWQGAAWFGSVLLAGLLIGLGAPFWFDMARGLSRSLQLLKGAGGKSETPSTAAGVDASAAPPPRTPVEAFMTAIAASAPPRIALATASEEHKRQQ